MPVIKNLKDLENYILVLEAQKEIESKALMVELKNSKSNFNQVNLIGEAISKLAKNPNIQNDVINGVLSFIVGYASKKLAIGSTSNPIKQLLGTFLQIGVSSVVNKNVDMVGIGKILLSNQTENNPDIL